MARFLKVAAIGCAVCLLGGVVLAGVTAVVGGAWLKGQVSNLIADESSDYARRLAPLRQARPFQPPADGAFTEEQLERFLAVCERYRKLRSQLGPEQERRLEELQRSRNLTFEGVLFWWRLGNELREAFLGGLEQERLSLEEYRYLHASAFKAMSVLIARAARQEGLAPEGGVEASLPAPGEGGEDAERVREIADDLQAVPEGNVDAVWRQRARVEEALTTAPRGGMLFPLLADEAINPAF